MSKRLKLIALVVIPIIAIPLCDWAYEKFSSSYSIGVSVQKNRYCLPWRLFLIRKGDKEHLEKGEMVAFWGDERMPEHFRRFTLIKMVVGIPGDEVKINNKGFWINGIFHDGMWLLEELNQSGRGVPWKEVEIKLGEDEYFLIGTSKDSLDSRYFGAVHLNMVIGRAVPLL